VDHKQEVISVYMDHPNPQEEPENLTAESVT
jgi:hypothetical protein